MFLPRPGRLKRIGIQPCANDLVGANVRANETMTAKGRCRTTWGRDNKNLLHRLDRRLPRASKCFKFVPISRLAEPECDYFRVTGNPEVTVANRRLCDSTLGHSLHALLH